MMGAGGFIKNPGWEMYGEEYVSEDDVASIVFDLGGTDENEEGAAPGTLLLLDDAGEEDMEDEDELWEGDETETEYVEESFGESSDDEDFSDLEFILDHIIDDSMDELDL